MVLLTEIEKKALLILFKDFTAYFNANSSSKILRISRVGALKLFRRLEAHGLLKSQRIGKAIIYKLRLEDDYVKKLIAFLLADEANNFKRWKAEFKELYKEDRIVMIFGSVLRNYETANDIDLLIAAAISDRPKIQQIVKSKAELLPKKLHTIQLTVPELEDNVRRREATILDIVKTGVVLYGQDEYVEVLKNVAGG